MSKLKIFFGMGGGEVNRTGSMGVGANCKKRFFLAIIPVTTLSDRSHPFLFSSSSLHRPSKTTCHIRKAHLSSIFFIRDSLKCGEFPLNLGTFKGNTLSEYLTLQNLLCHLRHLMGPLNIAFK